MDFSMPRVPQARVQGLAWRAQAEMARPGDFMVALRVATVALMTAYMSIACIAYGAVGASALHHITHGHVTHAWQRSS